jgi:hypothetical protein
MGRGTRNSTHTEEERGRTGDHFSEVRVVYRLSPDNRLSYFGGLHSRTGRLRDLLLRIARKHGRQWEAGFHPSVLLKTIPST